ncbi:MAG: class I SAM-dependent methyltransferase [Solirubrobacterales bacterium]
MKALQAAHAGRLSVLRDGKAIGSICRADITAYTKIVAELGSEPNLEISPRDEMLDRAKTGYLAAGLSALGAIRRAVEMTGCAPTRILDFACGHGRVVRFLQAAFPAADITVSDIDPDAVAFCRETFGVRGFVSSEEPGPADGCYDVIWCGSLLTHLDAERWPAWLAFFRDQLDPSGVLVFTTHGAHAAEEIRRAQGLPSATFASYDATGFGYSELSGRRGYGDSLSALEWVRKTVEDASLRVIHNDERGWSDFQDVIVCVRS